tara:strand:+ start:180 stop:440 length:261 start_codon:yes stop_codon:yes gene_type:complete
MKKVILLIFAIFLTSANAKDFKLPDINPYDLVKKGFVLHSVTPMPGEGPRTMLYTFTHPTKKNIASCVVELFDMSADLHICYEITQ